MRELIKQIIRGLSIGLLIIFFLTLLNCLPPIIFNQYSFAGTFNCILHLFKNAINRNSLILLPIFFAASLLYFVTRRRLQTAYLLAFSVVFLALFAIAGYWINQQEWAPPLVSLKGVLFNGIFTIGFFLTGTVLYFLTRRIHLSTAFHGGSIIAVTIFILTANLIFFVNNRTTPGKAELVSQRKILLIGVDGADWDIITPMVKKGQLPNIRRLMRNGSYGDLKSIIPTLSPIIWTSIATGKVKEKHGISHFLLMNNRETVGTPFTSNMRRVKAVWNVLSDFSKKVAVIGWWVTWPAEKVNGYLVSSYISLGQDVIKGMLRTDVPKQTYPEVFFSEIEPFISKSESNYSDNNRKIFGSSEIDELAVDTKKAIDDSKWILIADDIFKNIGLHLLQNKSLDFTTVFFGGIDVVSHRFWKYMEPQKFGNDADTAEVILFKNVIKNYYELFDSIVGEYLSIIDDNTTVIIISDHGFHAKEKPARLKSGVEISGDHEDAPDGIFIISGEGVKKGFQIKKPNRIMESLYSYKITTDIYDIVPTLLYLMGMPIAEDMDGEVITKVVASEYLKKNQIRFLNSYEDKDTSKKSKDEEPLKTPLDKELRDRLRGLGYIN